MALSYSNKIYISKKLPSRSKMLCVLVFFIVMNPVLKIFFFTEDILLCYRI